MFEVRRKLKCAVLVLFAGTMLFALQVAQSLQGKPENEAHQRQIKLEEQDNLRDLGGYRTTDGHTVKWGLIYRSGQISKLSDADVSKLKDLKISTVIDLRGKSEIKSNGKDRLPANVRNVNLGISVKSLNKAAKSKSGSTDPADINKDSMIAMTRSIMIDHKDVYSALIKNLAKSQNRPLLFHCSAGKDRTGVGAAIVLTLLGVPWETVREDYLLSNVYRKDSNEKDLEKRRNEIAKKKDIPPEKVNMSGYRLLYYVEAEYIDAAHQEAIRKYGSMDAYLRKGLGISDEMINKLRKELLD
jgi:protein-tyrosine phosphatase